MNEGRMLGQSARNSGQAPSAIVIAAELLLHAQAANVIEHLMNPSRITWPICARAKKKELQLANVLISKLFSLYCALVPLVHCKNQVLFWAPPKKTPRTLSTCRQCCSVISAHAFYVAAEGTEGFVHAGQHASNFQDSACASTNQSFRTNVSSALQEGLG